jgi:predicted metal-dependent enzyme (double-stranded beta helix superfamily)
MNDFEQLNQELHKILERKPALPRLIEQVSPIVSEFAGNTRWFHEFIENKVFDTEFFSAQLNSIWTNEITLFRSSDREVTILAYIWSPHSVDTIHDHGSWGIIAPFGQPIDERKYRRLDDGTNEGYAELKEISYKTIKPGDTTSVLPLDEGIHRIENPTENHMMSLNVYGQPLRHGYVHFFDQASRKVWRAFPPRTYKQIMAIRAMANIDEPWVERLLTNALNRDLPDFIKDQCQFTLRQLEKTGPNT